MECWCGSKKKWKRCHYPFWSPNVDKLEIASLYKRVWGIILKSDDEISGISKACFTAQSILGALCKGASEGTMLCDLNDMAMELHSIFGAMPASLGYGTPPFPSAICTSLNDEVCHGIPDKRKLKPGDILNIDVTSIVDGFYGDCSKMVCIEPVSDISKNVVETSRLALENVISAIGPGMLVCKIGDIIAETAKKRSCSVVDSFVGHGTGIKFHEPPNIFHCKNSVNIPMVPGMIFTIEPMINAGCKDTVIDTDNGWTARTKDGMPSAQWEHTVLINEHGCVKLT